MQQGIKCMHDASYITCSARRYHTNMPTGCNVSHGIMHSHNYAIESRLLGMQYSHQHFTP